MDDGGRQASREFDFRSEFTAWPNQFKPKPDVTTDDLRIDRGLVVPLDDFDALISTHLRANLPIRLREALDRHLLTRFPDELTRRATHSLHEQQPEMSALSASSRWQIFALFSISALLPLGLWKAPQSTVFVLLSLALTYFVVSMILKSVLIGASLVSKVRAPAPPSQHTPIVTIFMPVRNEAEALFSLVASLERLDYSKDKLDLKFLVEEEDLATLDTLERMKLPGHFDVISVPRSDPQTKPKAMNYALPFARGEIIGIYDAEDAPESDQIRKAIGALDAANDLTVCVQCRLNHYRATETKLSRMASAEYTLWFDMLLVGLSALKLPIPLGGTSLFIKASALRDVGGWDPNNVTEDADLGVRLARRGWRAEVIESTTWEEPPVKFNQWSGQRSRWIKGFMVTWLVHMRSPRKMFRELGWLNAIAINIMLLDGFIAFLIQPIFWMALVYFAFFAGSPWGMFYHSTLATMLAVSFGIGQLVVLLAAFVAVLRRFGFRRAIWTPGLWFYWQCATIPAYRALYEMFGKRFWWNKTEHGLSQAARDRRDEALRDR